MVERFCQSGESLLIYFSFHPFATPLQVFNTASHFTALMLSILGSAALIVKASVEVGSRC